MEEKEVARPTMILRYVYRDGRYILQQKFNIFQPWYRPVPVRQEWHDVPLEEEDVAV